MTDSHFPSTPTAPVPPGVAATTTPAVAPVAPAGTPVVGAIQPTYAIQQRWEYRTEFMKVGLFSDAGKKETWIPMLEQAGVEGWELVQVTKLEGKHTRDGYHFVFKRPAATR